MKQYHDLAKHIQKFGTDKPPARGGMPGSRSWFGYQNRYDLGEGFPFMTTKKIGFKTVCTELIWFLRGDTNVKYLVDNKCNIWTPDAYNYYLRTTDNINKELMNELEAMFFVKDGDVIRQMTFQEFEGMLKTRPSYELPQFANYKVGDCGYQYGKVWRDWVNMDLSKPSTPEHGYYHHTDQISKAIDRLITSPESRRHVITAVDPAHDEDLALYWCHSLFQFNCRPLTDNQSLGWINANYPDNLGVSKDSIKIPKHYLDCNLYQRSADLFLGVPFNIASYSLFTCLLADITNMIPGHFIHSFGDVHIYDNHIDAMNLQLSREPRSLPKLIIHQTEHLRKFKEGKLTFNDFAKLLTRDDFELEGYDPYDAIDADLSVGTHK